MKTLLLDQGLPRSTVKCLHDAGFESVHVGELGMAAASDVEILDYAGHNDFVVVTLDSDFHTLLAMRQGKRPTVIRIRIEGLKGSGLAQLLKHVIDSAEDDIFTGAALSVSDKCHAFSHKASCSLENHSKLSVVHWHFDLIAPIASPGLVERLDRSNLRRSL